MLGWCVANKFKEARGSPIKHHTIWEHIFQAVQGRQLKMVKDKSHRKAGWGNAEQSSR